MGNDKQREDLYFQLLKECDNESVRLPPGMKLFADKIYQFAQIVQQHEIDRLNAENERLNAKMAESRNALTLCLGAIIEMTPCAADECKQTQTEWKDDAEEVARKALASTDTTWLDRKLAEAKREMLEEAAKWFEEDGCTLLPSSVECAVELRRMGADLKA